MNCFDFHIALNIIWLVLSISNMVAYLLQSGWRFQVVTVAASLAFAIIQTAIQVFFLRQLKFRTSQALDTQMVSHQYMRVLMPIVTITNMLRLLSFYGDSSRILLSLETCFAILSWHQMIITNKIGEFCPFLWPSLYSVLFFCLASWRLEYTEIFQLSLFSMLLHLFVAMHAQTHNYIGRNQMKILDEIRLMQTHVTRSEKLSDQRDDKIIQNNVNITLYNDVRGLKRSDIFSDYNSQQEKGDYLMMFSSVTMNAPIAMAIIDQDANPLSYNDTFRCLINAKSSLHIQTILSELKVIKVAKKANDIPIVKKSRHSLISEKIVGSSESHFFIPVSKSPNSFSEILRIISQTGSNLQVLDYESQHLDPNKTLIYVGLENQVLTQRRYFVLYLIDIAEREKYATKKVMLKLMNQLFRSFSHEFSTSLNGIQAIAQAAEEDLPKDLAEIYMVPILNSCAIMNSIVQDVRDFSMILSKQFMIRIEQLNIASLVGYCYKLFAKQFQMRNIEFEFCPDENLTHIGTDGARLQQIIINLLSNSQKHTSNSYIRLFASQHDSSYVRISVEDGGKGMNQEDQDRLHRLLTNQWASQGPTQSDHKNFGMGLMISNQLALSLSRLRRESGGGIQFSSQQNKGSTFSFLVLDQQSEQMSESRQTRNCPLIKLDRRTMIMRTSNCQINSQEFTRQLTLRNMKRNIIGNKASFIQLESSKFQHQNSQLSEQFLKEPSQKTLRSQKNSKKYAYASDYSSMSADVLEVDECLDLKKFRVHNPVPKMRHPDYRNSYNNHKKCTCVRAIIMDDEYINIIAMQMLLKGFDILVDYANDGIEGVQKVIQRHQNPCRVCGQSYQLILMDVDMPGLNGIDATRQIMSYYSTRRCDAPLIIAQTAFVDAETQNQCMRVGMNHFLSKPINKQELKNALAYFDYKN